MQKLKLMYVMILMMLIGGCSLIGGIFEAGFLAGLIGVLVVLLIIFGIIKLFQKMWKN